MSNVDLASALDVVTVRGLANIPVDEIVAVSARYSVPVPFLTVDVQPTDQW